MSYNNEERPHIRALMNLFVAMNELCKYHSVDHSIDVLDLYLRTGNPSYLPSPNDFRTFVVNSNIREEFLPIYEEEEHLYDYIDGICPKKKLKK